MEWKGRRQSTNIQDMRGRGTRRGIGGGLGIGGIVIALVFTLISGGNPLDVLTGMFTQDTGIVTPYQPSAEEEELAQFVSVVLAETEDVWTQLFADEGETYVAPKLVLYTDSVESACGSAGSSTGPFYCSGDEKVYIDLSFFRQLRDEFQAPGDFAMAYVIAHEVGHHVQNRLGITDQVMELRTQMDEAEFNTYLVRLELQADYLSGVWAHYANRTNLLEAGDLEEALTAANAVGDDRIQKNTRGYVVPDSFTHGTSEQRQRWFMKGYTSGTLAGGDTFKAETLHAFR